MKLGNLTQESLSSVGADEAPNGLGQLVTQPVPGVQAWSEGFLGQGSVRGRLEGWDYFWHVMFWETLKGRINSGVRINCELGSPVLCKGSPEHLGSTLGEWCSTLDAYA